MLWRIGVAEAGDLPPFAVSASCRSPSGGSLVVVGVVIAFMLKKGMQQSGGIVNSEGIQCKKTMVTGDFCSLDSSHSFYLRLRR